MSQNKIATVMTVAFNKNTASVNQILISSDKQYISEKTRQNYSFCLAFSYEDGAC